MKNSGLFVNHLRPYLLEIQMQAMVVCLTCSLLNLQKKKKKKQGREKKDNKDTNKSWRSGSSIHEFTKHRQCLLRDVEFVLLPDIYTLYSSSVLAGLLMV